MHIVPYTTHLKQWVERFDLYIYIYISISKCTLTTHDVKKILNFVSKIYLKKNIDQVQYKLIRNFISTTFQSKHRSIQKKNANCTTNFTTKHSDNILRCKN